ncbi:MAG: YmdB family metallophosphoesterase [Clostridia bacterium]|nr:YmdB family metallophosphoesterase [Clostridia bacterium]
MIKILCLGDVVSPAAVDFFEKDGLLRKYKDENGIAFTVINGENASENNGLAREEATRLLRAGADVITTGNHVWKNRDLRGLLDDSEAVLRPANYDPNLAGKGHTVINVSGLRFLVINILGVCFMEPLDNPFDKIDSILASEEGNYDVSILDIHAEATGEKCAIAGCFDGRINVIFGTHTHVQTADERILPKGSGYITDLGMCGPASGTLGMLSDRIIKRLRYHIPQKFEHSQGKIKATGAVFTLDERLRTVSVDRVVLKQQ